MELYDEVDLGWREYSENDVQTLFRSFQLSINQICFAHLESNSVWANK